MWEAAFLNIKGTAVLEGADAAPQGRLTVRLLDVSYADAPSVTIADQVIDIAGAQTGDEIAFSLDVPDDLDLRARYILAGHLDTGRRGAVAKGDFVSMEAFPWRPGAEGPVSIRLRRVSGDPGNAGAEE